MHIDSYPISLATLIGTSTMLGHRLEDRSRIRGAQDPSLMRVVDAYSAVPLHNVDQEDLFAVAPLDILVSDDGRDKQFHLLEINGTGIGGFTNLPDSVISAVLEDLQQFTYTLTELAPVVLVAISGKECDSSPRLNKLVHEKILYVEALKRGFHEQGRSATVTNLPLLLQDPASFDTGEPTIVLGYIKDFVDNLTTDDNDQLMLFGRPVAAGVNDRFCLNVMEKFQGRVDLESFVPMNRCFLAGGDKGVAYSLLNDYLATSHGKFLPKRVLSERVHCRQDLIEAVLHWVREGIKTVIKPQGTGLGHGIEFFLSPNEPVEDIITRIDRSLRLTQEYYHISGGAFPYTLCEYVEGATINRPQHSLHGRKYELRVVVYRDGTDLKAFPSIVKVASEVYDPRKPAHLSLINNITTSAQASKKDGTTHMLPLANRDTLKLLGLRAEHLIELCSFATGFMRDVLDRVQSEPRRFGLPAAARHAAVEPAPLRVLQAA